MNGLCHKCWASNVELVIIEGQPICKVCDNPNGTKSYTKIASIKATQMTENFEVKTLEGTMKGVAGDYLATGVNGEKYPIKKEIFEKTYKLS